jgi:colanic acid/amylovoran biosynthesis glycosyltransferase
MSKPLHEAPDAARPEQPTAAAALPRPAEDGAGAPAGTPVVYIMSRFPKLTETFILREMLEMERQGQPVFTLPLLSVQQPVRHPEAEALKRKAVYTPFVSRDILAANLHYVRRSPRAYCGTLWAALRGNVSSANLFVGAIGIFPKSVYYARLVEERGLRHVHAHFATHPALAALIVSELTGVSFSFTVHGHDLFLYTAMLCEKMRRARFIVTVSEYNKRHMLGLCPEVAAEKIKIVRCGIEPQRYEEARRTARPEEKAEAAPHLTQRGGPVSAGDSPFTIVCVASLETHKGIEYLVKACALLKQRLGDFKCLVAGEGGERGRLEKMIDDAGLGETVRLLGAQPQGRVAELLSEADLFVLPSTRDSLPVVLMEAMASRLPVVATNLCGIPELVQDGDTGLLVPAGDEQALARAIARLYDEEGLRREMGRRGAEKVNAEFELSGNVSKLRSLFAEALGPLDAIKEQIRRNAHAYFSERACGRVGVQLRQRTDGNESVIYEATLEGESCESRAAILKIHRPVTGSPEDRLRQGRENARREYESLSFLWGEFSKSSNVYGVPKPLDYFPEAAALLMEMCDGPSLSQFLRWSRLHVGGSRFETVCGKARACGQWLALFHRVTRRERRTEEVYRRIEAEFHQELETCARLGLGPALAARVAKAFDEKKGLLFSGHDSVVAYHCDFGPHNVLFSRGRVIVLDFEGMRDGIAYEDIGHFLSFVDSTPKRHLSREQSRRLKESFLSGYAEGANFSPERADAFMLVKMVKLMAYNPQLREGGARRRRRLLGFYSGWLDERTL